VVAADEITGSQNAIAEAGRRAGAALARQRERIAQFYP